MIMDSFISNCEFKTPPMKVKVFDKNGILKKEYDTPPGFQLDRYVMSLHPKLDISFGLLGEDFRVDAHKGETLVERHVGIYKTKI